MADQRERPLLYSGPMVRATLEGRKVQTRRIVRLGSPEAHARADLIKVEGGFAWFGDSIPDDPVPVKVRLRYRKRDSLWVRETWRVGAWNDDGQFAVDYRADGKSRREWLDVPDGEQVERLWVQSSDDAIAKLGDSEEGWKWKPGRSPCRWRSGRYMPRWASRISLEVTGVRVERLQDISEEDAVAEGVTLTGPIGCPCEGESEDPGPHLTACPWSHLDLDPDNEAYRAAFAVLWDSINGRRGYPWALNPWVEVYTFPEVRRA